MRDLTYLLKKLMNLANKTFLSTQTFNNRSWFIIDCEGQTLGRLATTIVAVLTGKTKSYYSPSTDVGDYIILTNADLILLNEKSKHYFVYNPGKPGHSLKTRDTNACLPQILIEKAIRGMLPRSKKNSLMSRLKIYRTPQHPHIAQNPKVLDVETYNARRKISIIN